MIQLSIRRPVAVTMVYLTITVLGVAAWKKIPLEFLPNTDLPRLSVNAGWAGTSAETVEAFVTAPLESEIQQVQGVEKVSSTSSAGNARIDVTFARGTDMDFARLELSERMRALADRLPPRVFPTVTPYVPPEFAEQTRPLLNYTVTGPYTLEALRDHVDKIVVPAIHDVDGVARVDVTGGAARMLRVQIDTERARSLGLTIPQIESRISGLEFIRAVGGVEQGGRLYSVAIRERADSLRDLRNLVLLSDRGRIVRLGDVAELHDTFEDQTTYARINGFPSLNFSVYRQPNTNAVQLADRIKARLDTIAPQHPVGTRLILAQDQSVDIRSQLNDLGTRAGISAVTIFLVLLLFLQSFRSAFIIFTTIAFSILIALNLMYFAGYSLNILTLMGLAMGFGLVVDNAIVVLENVYRRWRLGEDPAAAAEHGARDVVLAIMAATLTTLVVFIPFLYLQGELRLFYLPLAIVVGFSLVASQFVAFSFIPALASRLLRGGAGGRRSTAGASNGLSTADEHSAVRGAARTPEELKRNISRRPFYVRAYAGVLGVTLRFPWVAIVVAAMCLGGAYYKFNKDVSRGMRWNPQGNQRSTVNISIRMPQGEELERTNALAGYFEARLKQIAEVEEFRTRVSAAQANITVYFPEELEGTAAPEYLVEELSAIGAGFAGPSFNVSGAGRSFQSGGGGIGSAGNYTIRVFGYNYERVRQIADDIALRLSNVSRVVEVDPNAGSGFARDRDLELIVRVNREGLARYNVTSAQVVQQVAAAVRGEGAARTIRIGGEELRLRTKLDGFESFDLLALQQMQIPGPTGGQVPLREVAEIEERRVLNSILRENQQYQRTIRYEFRGPAKLGDRVRNSIVDNTTVPDGYKVEGASEWQWDRGEQKQIWGVLALSLILVYMVTAALFESLRQPLLVLLTVPMALIGVFIIFLAVNANFTREAYIGVIMMGGIVVNNAILLVDRVNQLRREGGVPLHPAIVQGTMDRVRPILMTTVVTIAGMLPLVMFGVSANANIWNALAYALIGGLSSSTILVLSVTPAIYLLFERRSERRRLAVEAVIADRGVVTQPTASPA
jgi:hydrophobic/amphiphilic exporter-1 (mainly G- bacteria), HAE1 family